MRNVVSQRFLLQQRVERIAPVGREHVLYLVPQLFDDGGVNHFFVYLQHVFYRYAEDHAALYHVVVKFEVERSTALDDLLYPGVVHVLDGPRERPFLRAKPLQREELGLKGKRVFRRAAYSVDVYLAGADVGLNRLVAIRLYDLYVVYLSRRHVFEQTSHPLLWPL